jgi:hypothetical protein
MRAQAGSHYTCAHDQWYGAARPAGERCRGIPLVRTRTQHSSVGTHNSTNMTVLINSYKYKEAIVCVVLREAEA